MTPFREASEMPVATQTDILENTNRAAISFIKSETTLLRYKA